MEIPDWVRELFRFSLQDVRTLFLALVLYWCTDFLKKKLKKRGRIRENITGWKIWFQKQDAAGATVGAKPDDAVRVECRFGVEFFSEIESSTGLHGFTVHFLKGKTAALSLTPGECLDGGEYSRTVGTISLSPEKWTEKKYLLCILNADHVPTLLECDRVVLEALTPKGKRKTWKVGTVQQGIENGKGV